MSSYDDRSPSKQRGVPINDRIRERLGEDGETISPSKRQKIMWSESPAVDEKKKGNEAIRLCNMPDSEIYRKTELMKRNDLLAMLVLICNGDMNKMGDISTKLTSFEEWVLFLKYSGETLPEMGGCYCRVWTYKSQ